MKGSLTHWSLWEKTVSHTGLVATLKQLRYQLGRSQPPPVCSEGGRLTWASGLVIGANLVLHEYCAVTPEVSPCSLVGLPDFQEPAFGSAWNIPSDRPLEGKQKPVLWRGSIQTDVQTRWPLAPSAEKVQQAELRGTYKHPRSARPFLDPSL